MLRRNSKTTDLRVELSKALQSGRMSDALELYQLIERQKPEEPRWSHRKADLLLRMGREADAVRSYERAVYLYAAKGFQERAVATARMLLSIDPSKGKVLERVDPMAGQTARRNYRPAGQHLRPPGL